MKIKITASSLNIRSLPSLIGQILSKFSYGEIVEVVEKQGDWLKINHNGGFGFIATRYTEVIEEKPPIPPVVITQLSDETLGKITASSLNIRNSPNEKAQIIGKLAYKNLVKIIADAGEWLQIQHSQPSAFVMKKYVQFPLNDDDMPYLFMNQRLQQTPLEPQKKIPYTKDARQNQIFSIWNNYGGLLEALSESIDIDFAAAIAVITIESGGKGFAGDGRCLIRFENHIFDQYWGKYHPEIFVTHFKYDSDRKWVNHYFRPSENAEWVDFHGNQDREWMVLNFARTLDDTEALRSMSMGLSQIMGLNFPILGYNSVQEMFVNYCKDIRYHLFGFFDFLNENMKNALRNRDFVLFARYYNGVGMGTHYGDLMQGIFNTFNSFYNSVK